MVAVSDAGAPGGVLTVNDATFENADVSAHVLDPLAHAVFETVDPPTAIPESVKVSDRPGPIDSGETLHTNRVPEETEVTEGAG